MTLSTVVYFEPGKTDANGVRLTVESSVASAMMRAGVAAPTDPADWALLGGSPALDGGALTDVTLQHGRRQDRMLRLKLPISVAQAAIAVGIAGGVAGPVAAVQPFPFAGAMAAADFAHDTYYGGATFADLFTFTRASVKTDLLVTSPSGYAYRNFASGVPAITPGRGILIEEARTNYALNSAAPANQTITLPVTGSYRLWMNGPGSVSIAPNTAALTSGGVAWAGGTATQGVAIGFTVATTGTVDLVVNGTVYAMQVEAGGSSTSFIPTAGAAVARAQDSVTEIGAAATAKASTNGAVVMSIEATGATDDFAPFVRIGNNVLGKNNFDSGIFGGDDQGGDGAFYGALGQGRLSSAQLAVAWTGTSSRRIVGNGGLASIGSNMRVTGSTSYRLASNSTSSGNCYVGRVHYFATGLTSTQLRFFTSVGLPAPDIVTCGDSLMMRGDGPGTMTSVPQALAALLGRPVLNGGKGGDTTSQMLGRYTAAPELWGTPLIVQGSWNDQSTPSTAIANMAALVALNTSGRFFVVSVMNGSTSGEESGGSRYLNIKAINDAYLAAYGSRFVDVRAWLIANADPTNICDVFEAGRDQVPYTNRLVIRSGTTSTAVANGTATAISIGKNTGNGCVIKVDDEYIYVKTSSGTSITDCIRGYAGSTPAAHAIGATYEVRDQIHLSERGRNLEAQLLASKVIAAGW